VCSVRERAPKQALVVQVIGAGEQQLHPPLQGHGGAVLGRRGCTPLHLDAVLERPAAVQQPQGGLGAHVPLVPYTRGLPKCTFQDLSAIIRGTFRKHSRNIQGTFRAHSGNIQGTFRAHSGHIQGTFREHSGNIQRSDQGPGKLGEHSGNIQGISSEYSGNIRPYSSTHIRHTGLD
jgi:hypothetical protein